MKARGKNAVYALTLLSIVYLLLLTCMAYAAPAATQKSTQQVQPATGAASSLLNPNAPPKGTITITTPQSWATWYPGGNYSIQWTCSGTHSNLVDVTLWQNDRQVAAIWTAVATGRTAYIVPPGTAAGTYEVHVTSEDDQRIEARLPVVIADLDYQLKVVLLPIYFDINKSDLSANAKSRLNAIATFLKSIPFVRLLAEGNADEPGNAEYNMGIGNARALAVKTYLTGSGITADRLQTTSYGNERLSHINCAAADEECHANNRRVDWKRY